MDYVSFDLINGYNPNMKVRLDGSQFADWYELQLEAQRGAGTEV